MSRSEQRAHVLWELGGPVDLGGARRDLLVGQDAHGVAQHRLLVGQSVGGAGAAAGQSPRGIVAAHVVVEAGAGFEMPLRHRMGFAGHFCKAYASAPGGESRGGMTAGHHEALMDDLTLLALIGAAVLGLLAVLSLLRRERHEAEATGGDVEATSRSRRKG